MSEPAGVDIRRLDPQDAATAALLAQSDAHVAALYPPESNHMENAASLSQPNVHFIGAFRGNELLGCGAVKIMSDAEHTYGEIKRVFVPAAERGRGIARILMSRLEAHLLARGVTLVRLETGISQPEALRLYQRLGYQRRGPFGQYGPDPWSVFMEKRLG
jgi:putative acetyltransferase